jgi:hypothetical protein
MYKTLDNIGLENCYSTQLELFENEEFRSVAGYDGIYSVSNLGRVRSERRERPNGGFLKERILKIAVCENSCGVNLWENNKPKHFAIQVLVADAFINKSRDGRKVVVIHKNKDTRDNRLSNLLVDSKSVSNKIDYQLGNTHHVIQSMALSAIERGKQRDVNFGIYDGGLLVGYVCSRCFKECSLSDFSRTNTFCNHCKSISEGVLDIGKIRRRKELYEAGLQECSKCKKIKSLTEFYKSKRANNGCRSSCISCDFLNKPKQ